MTDQIVRRAARSALQRGGPARRALGGLAIAAVFSPMLASGTVSVERGGAEPVVPASAEPAPAPAPAARPSAALSMLMAPAAPAEQAENAAPPVQLAIPALGVDSRLVGLRVDRDGRLQTPQDYDRAGWYRDGVAPGDPGPAVLVGHVDSHSGPAVFYELGSLGKGDTAAVRRADGTTVTFVVQSVESFPKDRFPTDRVYGATPGPELRLVTCGGGFDHDSGHYVDNVVVFATLAPPAPEGRA